MSRSHHPVHAPVHAGSTPDPDHHRRSVSQGSTQVPSIMSHSVQSSDRARAHVKKEVQKLIKTKRLVVTRSTNGMVSTRSQLGLSALALLRQRSGGSGSGGSGSGGSGSGGNNTAATKKTKKAHHRRTQSAGNTAGNNGGLFFGCASGGGTKTSAATGGSSWDRRIIRFARNELQEIAYKISPFSVRQRLHLSAALYYERILHEKYPNGPCRI